MRGLSTPMAVKKATLPLRPCFAPRSHFIENLEKCLKSPGRIGTMVTMNADKGQGTIRRMQKTRLIGNIRLLSFLMSVLVVSSSCRSRTREFTTLQYTGDQNGVSGFILANTTSDSTLVILPMYLDNMTRKVPSYYIEEFTDGSWKRLGDWHPANPHGYVLDEYDINDCYKLAPHQTCEFSIPTPAMTNAWRISIAFEAILLHDGFWSRFLGKNNEESSLGGVVSPSVVLECP